MVFLAQPVDLVDKETLRQKVKAFRQTMIGLNVEVIAPYLIEPDSPQGREISREEARSILNADLAALDRCEVLVADLSVPGWQFIGVVFEMAYAFMKDKTIIVYTGSSPIGERTFVVGAADYTCNTLANVRCCLQEILRSRGER